MKKNAFNKYITVMNKSDNVFVTRIDRKIMLGSMETNDIRYYICNGHIALDINDYYYQSYFSGKKEYYFLLENKTTVSWNRKNNTICTLEKHIEVDKVFPDPMTNSDVINCRKTSYTKAIKQGYYNPAGAADIYATEKDIILINADYSKAITDCFEEYSLYNESLPLKPVLYIDSYTGNRAIALPLRCIYIPDEMKHCLIESVGFTHKMV